MDKSSIQHLLLELIPQQILKLFLGKPRHSYVSLRSQLVCFRENTFSSPQAAILSTNAGNIVILAAESKEQRPLGTRMVRTRKTWHTSFSHAHYEQWNFLR